MRAEKCKRCGRERCSWSTTGEVADCWRVAHEKLHAELADAKAEAERLRAMVDNVNADHDATLAKREADDLRRLAWEWCIEARYHYSAANDALRETGELCVQLQRLTGDAYEVDHRGNYPEPPIESLGPDVHEVALRIFERLCVTLNRPKDSAEFAYSWAHIFVARREGERERLRAKLKGTDR